MKKKPYFYIILVLLSVLFFCLMFSPDPTIEKIDNEISNFDQTVAGGNVIPDGNINYEVKNDFDGNKLSNFNAAVSNKITNVFKKFFNFIKKIIKKIVS